MSPAPPTPEPGPSALGVVTAWDDPRGWGRIDLDDGRAVALQCTDIADGSRTVEVGTRVRVVVTAGHHGLWHGRALTPA